MRRLFLLALALALLPVPVNAQVSYADKLLGVDSFNLLVYWPLDGNLGDASGGNYHLTASGGEWSSDGIGDGSGSYWFDGINDTLTFDCAVFNQSIGTVVFWSRLVAPWGSYGFGLRVNTDPVDDGSFRVMLPYYTPPSYPGIQYSIRTGGYNRGIGGTLPQNDDSWHLIALSWEAGGYAIAYVDGVYQGIANVNAPLSAPIDCTVGSGITYGFFHGNIAHVALWGSVLDQETIEYLADVPLSNDYQQLITLPGGQETMIEHSVTAGELFNGAMLTICALVLLAGLVLTVLGYWKR